MFVPLKLGATWGLLALFALALWFGGCAVDDELAWETDPADEVTGYGVSEQALATSDLRSANGTYGAACQGRAGGSWSFAISASATLDNAALSVIRGNSACQLTLTALRAGAGAGTLYTTSPGIALSGTYAATSAVFTGSGGSFTANAKLSATGYGANFTVDFVHSADASLGASSRLATYNYEATVLSETSLVSYWRLGDTGTKFVVDNFTGTSNALLSSRSGSVGASWTKHPTSEASAYISSAGRVRTNTSSEAFYYSSAVPSGADYIVQADLVVKSKIESDSAGVIGRVNTTQHTYYYAGYSFPGSSVGLWVLKKCVSGTCTTLAYDSAILSDEGSYKVALAMSGTTISMYVDGVRTLAVTDSSITAAGRVGVSVGRTAVETTYPSDIAGLHLDNLSAWAMVTDSEGTNHAFASDGVTFGVADAIANDANAAISLDGVDDYLGVSRPVSADFSLELWFKSPTGTSASSATQWYSTTALIDASVLVYSCTCGSYCCSWNRHGYGVGLRSDGKVVAGIADATNEKSILSSASTYRDGAWHHVVFTRHQAGGALKLYLDGASAGSLTGASTATLDDSERLTIGRLYLDANHFNGSIDEVAVYNTYLPAANVLKHYQVGH